MSGNNVVLLTHSCTSKPVQYGGFPGGRLFFCVLSARYAIVYLCRKRMNTMTDDEKKELELLFIEEELSQHGEWLADVLTEAIEKRKLRRTDDLLHSVNYSAFKEGKNPGLRFSFLSYGRAVDIAAYKQNRHKVDTMRDIWGQKQNTMKKKNNRWYARRMYSGYYKLVARIMYGLSDLEIERLKGILENRKKQL